MSTAVGQVTGINGNVIRATFDSAVSLGEVAYIIKGAARMMSEIVRITGSECEMQLFERPVGIRVGDVVEYSGEQLSISLGPGLLDSVYDGLQKPLKLLADKVGYFLEAGEYPSPLEEEKKWEFVPTVATNAVVIAGTPVGEVTEGIFSHKIMAPFDIVGKWTVQKIAPQGSYTLKDVVATITNEDGEVREVCMLQRWPIKKPIQCYQERVLPTETLETGVRIIDSLIPVAKGGTYCIPGPFGAGKTVLQQVTSRNAAVDIVIIAACGERAGEVVETLREFPELIDPRTGNSLMKRTVMVVNTSSMPVASRDASVYTACTIAEYYRQMGLDVLLLADSTSRWAQAMRELSGRLEEIPGEEAFPAYLESIIAAFYERAGAVRLHDGSSGSVTIGGTVSPAGGNFEEPVTQSTLKVVGAFHGLSRERSDARKYPAIDPLTSWSKYRGVLADNQMAQMKSLLQKGDDIGQMMKVIGEEGVSIDDYVVFLQAELLDAVYLQQNAFDEVDCAVPTQRQIYTYGVLEEVFATQCAFTEKEQARQFFYRLRQRFIDYNGCKWNSRQLKEIISEIRNMLAGTNQSIESSD